MRVFRVLPVLAAVCLCVGSPWMVAQSRILREISFTGAPGYSQAELLAVTGLKPGTSATQQQMEDAAQRLNDTGLFDDVRFAGNDKGIVYALKPAPASALLPVRFRNFVWWQDEEIDRTLKAGVPLYRGEAMPTSGKLRDRVCAALSAMLADKGVANATVASRPSSSRVGGPLDRVLFVIDSPAILVRLLTLDGASPAMQARLGRIVRDIAGQQWDKDATYDNIASRVRDVYHDEGYLDIAVVKHDHSAPAITANGIELDVSAALSEGAQYHVTQLAWPGSDLLSVADFNKQTTLKPGDHDSPVALRESLKSIKTAYGSKGYIDAEIRSPATVDRNAHQVAYSISVVPGPQYRFKSVSWPNVSAEQGKTFDAGWRLKPGDIYDGTYLMKFLGQNSGLIRQGYQLNTVVNRDPVALTVDLAVTFSKGAPPPL